MNKKELLALLDQTLIEMGVAADSVYNKKQLFKKNEPVDKDKALEQLYKANYSLIELYMFLIIVHGDISVLLKQALGSNINYEKRYALSKYFSSINEAFKKLYGFPKENDPKIKLSTRWGGLSEMRELMTKELKNEYDRITDFLYNSSKLESQKFDACDGRSDLSKEWWNAVRTAESHFDAEKIIEQRMTYESEDQLVKDAPIFTCIMVQVMKFVSDLLTHINLLVEAYCLVLSKRKEL